MKIQKNSPNPVGVVILAAGLGKRMHSPRPKVLTELLGKPILFHILVRVARSLPESTIAIVVGHQREAVREAVRTDPILAQLKIEFIVQEEQKGTGHAVRCAMESEWGRRQIAQGAQILVLPGDLPLISDSLLQAVSRELRTKTVALRMVTGQLADPTGYGRVERRGPKKTVARIVEEKDASPRQKAIREVGVSIYLFQAQFLDRELRHLSANNAQSEYYLTDLVAAAVKSRHQIETLAWPHGDELRGINNLWELSQAAQLMRMRCLREWALQGVRFLDPASVMIDVTVQLAVGVVVYPGVVLEGATRIGKNSVVGPQVYLKNTVVDEDVHLKAGTVAESSEIGAGAHIGPYANLRPDSSVGSQCRIGNFVELKKTKIGAHTSVAHLSYLGDAEVGKNVNIGCGFVTCNFDGRIIDGHRKHKTIIEDQVFLGSDCQVIAPIRIGKNAYIASGSTITEDVEPNALAIARSRQVIKSGYATKLKNRSED